MSRYYLLLIIVGLLHCELFRISLASTADVDSRVMPRFRNRRENSHASKSADETTTAGEGGGMKRKLLIVIITAATAIVIEAIVCVYVCCFWSPKGTGRYKEQDEIAKVESGNQIAKTETAQQVVKTKSSKQAAKMVSVDEEEMAALKLKLELVAKEKSQEEALPSAASRTQVSGIESEESKQPLGLEEALEQKPEAIVSEPPLEIATEPGEIQKIEPEKEGTELSQELKAEPIPDFQPEFMPESVPDEKPEPIYEVVKESQDEPAELTTETEGLEDVVDSEAPSSYPMGNEPRVLTDRSPWQYGKIAERWRKLSVDAVPVLPTGSQPVVDSGKYTFGRQPGSEEEIGDEAASQEQDEKDEPDAQGKEEEGED